MFVRPQKWAHGNGRVKRRCHVKYELSSPPRTPSKCSLKYISAVCLLFLLTKVIFSKEATPTHFKFFLMRQPHFCHFWTFLLLNLKPVCILKKIVTMNVAKTSRKNFFLSNIWKNATFIENNFFPEMARLWTFFTNRNWFQLVVYYFSKKKNFSLKDYPNSF